VPDVITEREGWLVPPEQPRALAAAITEALENVEEARTRAERASLRLVSAFGRDAWLDHHDQVYTVAQAVRQRAR
jgi:glycosyltransferase involved in cell wall biosynthesis